MKHTMNHELISKMEKAEEITREQKKAFADKIEKEKECRHTIHVLNCPKCEKYASNHR